MSVSTVFFRLQSAIYGQTLRNTRKLANNTYGTLSDGPTATVRYHNTDIVVATLNRVTYYTGGWYTFTTKDRINRYLPNGWRLWSDKNVWQVGRFNGEEYVDISRFYDGISFVNDANDNPVVENPQPAIDPAKALRKRISKYTQLYTADSIKEMLEHTVGDCFYCQVETQNEAIDNDHIRSHLDEGYAMASLAFNALKSNGYPKPALILHIDRDGSVVRRAVRKYMTARLVTDSAGAQGQLVS